MSPTYSFLNLHKTTSENLTVTSPFIAKIRTSFVSTTARVSSALYTYSSSKNPFSNSGFKRPRWNATSRSTYSWFFGHIKSYPVFFLDTIHSSAWNVESGKCFTDQLMKSHFSFPAMVILYSGKFECWTKFSGMRSKMFILNFSPAWRKQLIPFWGLNKVLYLTQLSCNPFLLIFCCTHFYTWLR